MEGRTKKYMLPAIYFTSANTHRTSIFSHTHTRTGSDSRRKQLVEDMGEACLLQRDGVHGERAPWTPLLVSHLLVL